MELEYKINIAHKSAISHARACTCTQHTSYAAEKIFLNKNQSVSQSVSQSVIQLISQSALLSSGCSSFGRV